MLEPQNFPTLPEKIRENGNIQFRSKNIIKRCKKYAFHLSPNTSYVIINIRQDFIDE